MITLIVLPKGGEEIILIDGVADIAVQTEESMYKVTVTRGKHDLIIKKKGYYLYSDSRKITKTETVEIKLAKAVKYTKTGKIDETDFPMAIAGKKRRPVCRK